VTEKFDIKKDYFLQTERNRLIYSWLTVCVVFTYVCIEAYLLVTIKNTIGSTSTTYYFQSI